MQGNSNITLTKINGDLMFTVINYELTHRVSHDSENNGS